MLLSLLWDYRVITVNTMTSKCKSFSFKI